MFENKKILVLGMARRGYEAAKYLDYGINTLKKAEIIKK